MKTEFKVYNAREKKRLAEIFKEDFGMDYDFRNEVIIETGKSKLWIASKGYAPFINIPYRVETIGLYFAQTDKNGELRLSTEGAILLGRYATKRVIEINKEQREYWIRGINFDFETKEKGFVLLKYGNDFVGCGKATGNIMLNHVPKERRIKRLI